MLIFTRFGWKLATTIINPSHDERIHHLQGVLDSSLLLVYDGVAHYMAIFKLHLLLNISKVTVSIRNVYMKQSLNGCL